MKRLFIFLFLFLSYFGYSQVSPQYQNITIRNKADIKNVIILQGDTLVKWYKESDTAKTIYHVLVDSSFLVKYGNTQLGHGEYLGTPLLGMSETDGDTSTAIFIFHSIEEWGNALRTQIGDSVAQVSTAYDPTGDMKIYTQLYVSNGTQEANLNVTGDRILLEADTTRITGQIFAPGIEPEAGAKFYEMVGYGLDGRLFPRASIDWYDAVMDSIGKAPTVYSTWVRDTTNGYLYPANTSDTVYIPQVVKLGAQLYAPEMGFQLIPSTEMNVLVKNDYTGLIHTYPLSQFQTTMDTSGTGLWGLDSANNIVYTNETDWKVGIGTKTPAEALDVYGNINLLATTTTKGMIKQNNLSFLHTYAQIGRNLFLGVEAGSLTAQLFNNTAIGAYSMDSLLGGLANTAVGSYALTKLKNGTYNTAIGTSAMYESINSGNCVAVGESSLRTATVAAFTTAIGTASLQQLSVANYNTAIGYLSGNKYSTGNMDTTTRSIYIGAFTQSKNDNDTNQIVIGTYATGEGSNTFSIGDTTGNLLIGNFATDNVTVKGNLTADTVEADYYRGKVDIGEYYANWVGQFDAEDSEVVSITAVNTTSYKAIDIKGAAPFIYSYSNGITVPTDSVITFPTAGRYLIEYTLYGGASSAIMANFKIEKNDNTALTIFFTRIATTTAPSQLTISSIANISANDYLELKVKGVSGSQNYTVWSTNIVITKLQ